MSDLLFTAGIDDRQFRRGMRGIEQSARGTSVSLGKLAKVGLGVFGAATLVSGIRKVWKEASEAVREYADNNMFAAKTLSMIDRSFARSETAAGRFFMAILEGSKSSITAMNDLFTSGFEGTQKLLFGAASLQRMKMQEAQTKEYRRRALERDIGGPMSEDILRLQGRGGEADRLEAMRTHDERQARYMDMLRKGEIDQRTFADLDSRSGHLRNLQIAEALKRDVRSFSGGVPRALRGFISNTGPSQAEAKAEARAKRMEQKQERANTTLSRIERNTRGSGTARWGP